MWLVPYGADELASRFEQFPNSQIPDSELACVLPEFGEWYHQARTAGTPEHSS